MAASINSTMLRCLSDGHPRRMLVYRVSAPPKSIMLRDCAFHVTTDGTTAVSSDRRGAYDDPPLASPPSRTASPRVPSLHSPRSAGRLVLESDSPPRQGVSTLWSRWRSPRSRAYVRARSPRCPL